MSPFLFRASLRSAKPTILSSTFHLRTLRSQRYFSEVQRPRAFWETQLQEYVREGRRLRAHEVTREMITDGHDLSLENYHELMKVNIRHNNVPLACELLERMETEGIHPTYQTLRLLVLGFCHNGQLEAAVNMFETIFDHAAQIKTATTLYSSSSTVTSVGEDRELIAEMVEWFGYFLDLEGLVDFVRVLYQHSVVVDEEILGRVKQLLGKDFEAEYLISLLNQIVQKETEKLNQSVSQEKKQ